MLSAGAGAAPITIGPQVQKGSATLSLGAPTTVFNASLAAPASLTSPVSGLIVRWRVVVGAGTGPLTLRVLQISPGNKVTGIASGPSQEMTAGTATPVEGQTIYTLPANLPIAAGQTIGIDGKSGSPAIALLSPTSGSIGFVGTLANGETQGWSPFPGFEMLVNADVQPPPTVGALSPPSGPTTAGFPVVIAGTDLTGVKAVEFGGLPAQRFIPGTEGELTAFPPPVSAPGTVPVTVTTIAGKSTNTGTYTYTACVVPKLTKKKLKADRKALAAAGCTLGNVKRKRHAGKKAKVTKQSVKAGTVLPVGSSVGVTVG
jgi:hypothetical protein